MCLAVPAEVVALLEGGRARVSLGGITKEISLALVDDVAVGDYVLLLSASRSAGSTRKRRGARSKLSSPAASWPTS